SKVTAGDVVNSVKNLRKTHQPRPEKSRGFVMAAESFWVHMFRHLKNAEHLIKAADKSLNMTGASRVMQYPMFLDQIVGQASDEVTTQIMDFIVVDKVISRCQSQIDALILIAGDVVPVIKVLPFICGAMVIPIH